jgi:hypothetical protein
MGVGGQDGRRHGRGTSEWVELGGWGRRVVWVGGAHSKGRVRGRGCQSGNRWQIGAFQVPPKACKAGLRFVWRSTRLDHSKAKKVLKRGKNQSAKYLNVRTWKRRTQC